MPQFTITNFLGEIKNRDLARSHRFEIIVLFPSIMQNYQSSAGGAADSFRMVSMMAEDVLFPGMILGTRGIRLNNLNEQRATAIDFGGDSISITFLVDQTWIVKDIFGDWMRAIVDPESRTVAYPNDYYGQMEIYALDGNDEIAAKWVIDDCFPRSVAPITASSGNTQVVRLPVTFTYKRWSVDGNYQPRPRVTRSTEMDDSIDENLDPEAEIAAIEQEIGD